MFPESKVEKSQLIVNQPLYEKFENSSKSTEFSSKMTDIEAFKKNSPSENGDDVEKMIQELSSLISDLNNLKNEKGDIVVEGGRIENEEMKEGENEEKDEGEEDGRKENEGEEGREEEEEVEEIEREDDPNDFEEFGEEQNRIRFPSLEDSQTMNILAEKNKATKINVFLYFLLILILYSFIKKIETKKYNERNNCKKKKKNNNKKKKRRFLSYIMLQKFRIIIVHYKIFYSFLTLIKLYLILIFKK